jgi:hypothetical protein
MRQDQGPEIAMGSPVVTQEELQRVHLALCITVPLDQMSPLMQTTLAVVAHCWNRNGVPKIAAEPTRCLPRTSRRQADDTTQQFIDLKRRAAGDID